MNEKRAKEYKYIGIRCPRCKTNAWQPYDLRIDELIEKAREERGRAKVLVEALEKVESIAKTWWRTRRANPEELFDSLRRLRRESLA